LAVFLENRPGTLARVCEALAEARINIQAISTSDTVDHTVVRLVVDDPRKALFLFEERGTLVVENEVLLAETENRPGTMAAVARRLADARINIEYLYCSSLLKSKRGLVVLRVSNPQKALKVLNTAAPAPARAPGPEEPA
jgi:hypothetical protein